MEPHEQSFFVPLTDAPVGFGPGGISTAVDQRQAKRRGAKAALVARQPVMLQRKPRAEGSFDAGRSSKRLLEDKHPRQKFALTVGRGQFDIKVDAANRLCARWTSNVQGSDGQSPRANPHAGRKSARTSRRESAQEH
jgi:hypothetical protein